MSNDTRFGFFGAMVLIAIFVVVFIATAASADKCHEHNEKWVGVKTGTTLCERKDGTVVAR